MGNPYSYIPDSQIERVPPVDIDAERMCLGLMMVDPKLVPYIRQHVAPSDFYKQKHRDAARMIYTLADRGLAPYPDAVITEWEDRVSSDEDTKFIVELWDSMPVSENGSMAENGVWYAKRVKERSERRALLRMLTQKYSELVDPIADKSVEDIVGDMLGEVFQIHKTTEIVSVSSELGDIMRLIQSGNVFGIPTGFPSLDEYSCGYQNGEFYIIGGRPGMGKTAFALKLTAMLCNAGVKTLFISLEMAIRQLLLRLLSIEAQVPYRCFRYANAVAEAKVEDVVMAASKIAAWPFIVDDNPGTSIEQIIARVEAQVFQHDIEIVFIDHMHLIPASHGRNNVEAYSHISLMLKNLARQINIPVIVLAQLSRGPEGRPDPRPKLSDLRESGGIEQNADNVWFLYREDYYNRDVNTYNKISETELIIAKNKSLETGTIKMDFKGAFMEFVDRAKKPFTGERK